MIQARHGDHVVGWDGDFHFGLTPSDDDLRPSDPVLASVVGAGFLSGAMHTGVVCVDGLGRCQNFDVSCSAVRPVKDTSVNKGDRLVLCGPGCAIPGVVSMVCRTYPNVRVIVCPLLGPLAAFGQLVGLLMLRGLERPRMDLMYRPVKNELNLESQEFDEKLNNDGYGRMASLSRSAMPCVNQMMETPCISPFHGRVLGGKMWWGEPIFLMRPVTMEELFPTETVSLRYASMWVPVEVSTTEKFAEKAGWGRSTAKVVCASDYIPGMSAYLKFATVQSGKPIIVSSDVFHVPVPETIPLFRYNRAYNVDAKLFVKLVHDGYFRPL